MSINFISHKDSNETLSMQTKSDNVQIMMSSETDEIIEELLKSLLQKYQEGLEESMKERDSLFLIVLSYCITIFKNQVWKEPDHHI